MEIRQKIHSEAQRRFHHHVRYLQRLKMGEAVQGCRGDTTQCSYATGVRATTSEDKGYVKLSVTMGQTLMAKVTCFE